MSEHTWGAALPGAGRSPTAIDTEQVGRVVDFYDQAGEVVGAVSEQLRSHRFGSWVVGEEYRELGERFSTMSERIADRLAEQAVAAARLAEELGRAVEIVGAADVDAAGEVRASVPGLS